MRLLAVDNAPTAIWPTRQEEMARSIEEVANRIRSTPTQAVFGAVEGEVLVGVTGIRREPLFQVSHKATVWGVFVNPAYRGRGIAQTLLSAATAHAIKEWNTIQLMLCVNAENLPAKGLYASYGFQTFGLEPRAMKVGDRFYDEEQQSTALIPRVERGELDLAVATRDRADRGTLLFREKLVWVGKEQYEAWRRNPLPIAVHESGSRPLDAVLSKRSTKPSLFRASFRWLNPGDGDSTATTHRRPRRTGPPAIHATPGAARCTARGRWHEPSR